MQCRINDLRCKEVINICDGCRLGFVNDIELDTVTGQVLAIVIPGPCRFFGLFGREEDYVVAWNCITRIGEDIILVEFQCPPRHTGRDKRKRWG